MALLSQSVLTLLLRTAGVGSQGRKTGAKCQLQRSRSHPPGGRTEVRLMERPQGAEQVVSERKSNNNGQVQAHLAIRCERCERKGTTTLRAAASLGESQVPFKQEGMGSFGNQQEAGAEAWGLSSSSPTPVKLESRTCFLPPFLPLSLPPSLPPFLPSFISITRIFSLSSMPRSAHG